jgi:hypothetical protein
VASDAVVGVDAALKLAWAKMLPSESQLVSLWALLWVWLLGLPSASLLEKLRWRVGAKKQCNELRGARITGTYP